MLKELISIYLAKMKHKEVKIYIKEDKLKAIVRKNLHKKKNPD